MLPIGMMFGFSDDGAIRQAIEIKKQRIQQQCSCREVEENRIVGKSSDTVEVVKNIDNTDPGRYGVEYHLECTLADYL